MEVGYLKEFVVLAKTENYLEAAENLFISQSSLSKHIQALEKELDVTLFDRTTRKVSLNENGKVFLKYAQEMLTLQHQCQTALMNLKEAEEQNLAIGSIPIIAPYGITDLLLDFKQENVKINLSIIEGEAHQLKEKIRNGQCDLAFIRQISQADEEVEEEFSVIHFTTDHLVAVLPCDHPLANETLLELNSLKNEDFLFLQPDSMMYKLSLEVCQEVGFTPNIVYTGQRAENIIDLVSKGMGLSLLMAKPISYINTQNVVRLVPVLPNVETEIVVYYKKDSLLSKAASHFLNYLQK